MEKLFNKKKKHIYINSVSCSGYNGLKHKRAAI